MIVQWFCTSFRRYDLGVSLTPSLYCTIYIQYMKRRGERERGEGERGEERERRGRREKREREGGGREGSALVDHFHWGLAHRGPKVGPKLIRAFKS